MVEASPGPVDAPSPVTRPTRSRVRWGIGDFFWVLGAQFFAALVASVVLAAASGGTVSTDQFLLVGLPAQSLGVAVALGVVSRRKGLGSLTSDFGLRLHWRDWTAAFVGIGWRLVIVLLLLPFTALLRTNHPSQQIVQDLEAHHGPAVWASIVVVVGFVQPALEEILFRGLLLRALLRRMGPFAAVVISGFGFGLIHLLGANLDLDAVTTVVGLSAFGVLLATQALRYRSLSRPILTHAAFNLTVVVALLLTR